MNQFISITSLLIFVMSLINWGLTQTGIKPAPQIVLIGYGFFTIILSQLKNKIFFRILLYPLLLFLLFNALLNLSNWILDIISPNRGLVEIDGQLHGTNGDPYIFLEMINSLILSIFVVTIYYIKGVKQIKLERYLTLAFILLTLLIFLIFE